MWNILITKNDQVPINNFLKKDNGTQVKRLFQFCCLFAWTQGIRRQWERQVRSSSRLDELLRLTDVPDWKLWKCRLRLQPPLLYSEAFSYPSLVGSHRSTRYAAESYSLEILKGWIMCKSLDVGLKYILSWLFFSFSLLAIDEEWQRTRCMPRETCIDVAKELGTDPSIFFKPPCVSVHRWKFH